MTPELRQDASAYFQHYHSTELDSLLAPFDEAAPAGMSLREVRGYAPIQEARRNDDASLPMGGWEHELKQADWEKTATLCVAALVEKSKDLQLAAWLMEAEIHNHGFVALAPCVTLMQGLCEQYWQHLHPQSAEEHWEHRANILRWVNEKLLPPLRQVPLTAASKDRVYSWDDWERARRNEQLRASMGAHDAPPVEGPMPHDVLAALAFTSDDACSWFYQCLAAAEAAMAGFAESIDALFGPEGPSLRTLRGWVEQVQGFFASELHKRGLLNTSRAEAPATHAEAPTVESRNEAALAGLSRSVIRDRHEAYQRLSEAADFLLQLDPHSPAPYLVRRAVEWGRLDTPTLYQELFIKLGGQINIFDLLGLETAPRTAA